MPTNEPAISRPALAPGLLAAIALLAGLALLGSPDGYIVIRYIVSILALIIVVFAVQAKKWWWLVGLVPIAVLWNPVFPITIDDQPWLFLQFAACVVFVGAAIRITVPNPAARNQASRGNTTRR
ncbi:DUF6804 family protein [Compostimonas suwonensis]|uniref:Uncharacterized protein n=1 Tax=Compostimonas suwonensis TaxID=1048394 RepID=A0A2M9BU53_9MICO|nr:DUF6804 family protein [Compostimonas suwonensis]PJJ61473.1 hypothetical protein CLV54_2418 [Compostimonas suwonensis]